MSPTHNPFTRASQDPLTFIRVSIVAAIATIGLKFGAYALTHSVGLLSDAIEAFVNLAAALGALWALTAAARPPDERYHFGQAKAEYFSVPCESKSTQEGWLRSEPPSLSPKPSQAS